MSKRIVEHPFAFKRRGGGYVISHLALIACLKKGDAVEVEGVTVGTKELLGLVRLLPHQDSLIRCNGRLEIETVERYAVKEADSHFRSHFRKPKHNWQWFALNKGAWLPRNIKTTVVIKPRKF